MKIMSLVLAATMPLASIPAFACCAPGNIQQAGMPRLLSVMNEANAEVAGIYMDYVAARALIFAVKYGRFVQVNSPLSFKPDTSEKERLAIAVPLGALSLFGFHVGSTAIKNGVLARMPSRSALQEWKADFAAAQARTEAKQSELDKLEATNEVGAAEINAARENVSAAEVAEANLLTIKPSNLAPGLKRLGVKSIYVLGLVAVYYTAGSQLATITVDSGVLTNLPDIQARAEQDRLALKAAGFDVPGFIDYVPGFMK